MWNLSEKPALSGQSNDALTFDLSKLSQVIDSKTLFAQGNVVLIQHQGERYLLRRTRNGKLILTK